MTREEAIEFGNNVISLGFRDKTQEFCEMAVKAFEQQETATWLDHQNGRWIYAKCSKCETIHDVKSNYCPNCGRFMTNK